MSEETKDPMEFVSQSDVQGRLRLLRYGLIAVVILVFFVTWLFPYATFGTFLDTSGIEAVYNPDLMQFLTPALIATVIALVLALIVYFVYREILKRTMGEGES